MRGFVAGNILVDSCYSTECQATMFSGDSSMTHPLITSTPIDMMILIYLSKLCTYISTNVSKLFDQNGTFQIDRTHFY